MREIDKNQLLRFTTAGNVDDGKSTLIGRLLYDSKALFEDQLDAVEKTSLRKGHQGINLALFTDGLKDEVEQGITIDVAYRYFTTPKRKFIIADSPGHVEFTRNMVTGASTANAAIILIDSSVGVTEQTKRHSFIASLLQISHIIVCVNKMDLKNYSEDVFESIVHEYEAISSKMMVKDVQYIPISALEGDNVVHRSKNMSWFMGAPLLHTLETIHISSDSNKVDARLPIQTVITDANGRSFFAGRIAGGIFRPKDEIIVLPSMQKSKIKSIITEKTELTNAFTGMSISLTLEDEIDVKRGSLIAKVGNQPVVTHKFEAMICWLDSRPSKTKNYSILHACNEQAVTIESVIYKINIDTLTRENKIKELLTNDIAKVEFSVKQPLMVDSYRENRTMGSFILLDTETNSTVAAGMIV